MFKRTRGNKKPRGRVGKSNNTRNTYVARGLQQTSTHIHGEDSPSHSLGTASQRISMDTTIQSSSESDTVGITAKPDQFVRRGEDTYVPLVATDNLPEWINIEGFSKTFTLAEVTAMSGNVVFDGNSSIRYNVRTPQGAHDSSPSTPQTPQRTVPSDKSLHDRLTANLHANNVQRGRRTEQKYNPTTPGVLGQKVYCTHWIRTGECDFTQQGCMYVHCMPDLDTLEALGFRSYPRWFREMPFDYQKVHAKDFDPTGLAMNQQRPNPNASAWKSSRAAPPPAYESMSPAASIIGSPASNADFYAFGVYPSGYATTSHPPTPVKQTEHSTPSYTPPNPLPRPPQPAQRVIGPARRLARGYHYQPYARPSVGHGNGAAPQMQGNATSSTVSPSPPRARDSSPGARGTTSDAYSSEQNNKCLTPSLKPFIAGSDEHQGFTMDGSADPLLDAAYHALEPMVEYREKPSAGTHKNLPASAKPAISSDVSAAPSEQCSGFNSMVRLYVTATPSKIPQSDKSTSQQKTERPKAVEDLISVEE